MEFNNEVFDPQGNLVSSETVEVPDPAPSDPDPYEVFSAALRAELPAATTIAKMRTALTSALDALDAAIG